MLYFSFLSYISNPKRVFYFTEQSQLIKQKEKKVYGDMQLFVMYITTFQSFVLKLILTVWI